jgi:hypothetical protein
LYAEFVRKLVSRHAGRITALEVWNEPNAVTSYPPKPDPAGYVDLLKATYPVVKSIDPSVTVLGGALGSVVDFGDYAINLVTYLHDMYEAAAQGYFDVFTFHPYHYSLKFSDGVTVANPPVAQPASTGGEEQQNTYVTDILTKWHADLVLADDVCARRRRRRSRGARIPPPPPAGAWAAQRLSRGTRLAGIQARTLD